MQQNLTHAHEQLSRLSEALFRFSSGIDAAFGVHLRQLAVDLAGSVAASDESGIAGTLLRARGVIRLGQQLGVIAAADGETIQAAIARSQQMALPVPQAHSSASEFVAIAVEAKEGLAPGSAKEAAGQHAADESVAKPMSVPAVQQPGVQAGSDARHQQATFSASDRQGKLIATIRNNPNARMRDFLVALPGVSERTIRYDLERLAGSGKIEREGVGGPATWYRVREGVTA